MPANAFGSVPTPAPVAPIEFTIRRADYDAMAGGPVREVVSIKEERED